MRQPWAVVHNAFGVDKTLICPRFVTNYPEGVEYLSPGLARQHLPRGRKVAGFETASQSLG
jgi:hypothetical protein